MEQNANALPKVTLGQYKGLEFTRRVRPVSEKAVELEAANLTRTHAPFAPVESPPRAGCASRWILRASWTAPPSRTAGWKTSRWCWAPVS